MSYIKNTIFHSLDSPIFIQNWKVFSLLEIINSISFNIECFNDAFTTKNNNAIVKGIFDIKAGNGYDNTNLTKMNQVKKEWK